MKATVKDSQTFNPITVELVIENEVELAWLKAVSNMSIQRVKDQCKSNCGLLKKFHFANTEKAQMNFYNIMKAL